MSPSPELQFSIQAGCLVVTATGRYVLEHKETAILAIAKAIKDESVKAALLDMRAVKDPYTFMDRYQLGELVGRYLASYPVAALLWPVQADPGRIGLVVAKNRGANAANVFTDEAEALAWLQQFQTS